MNNIRELGRKNLFSYIYKTKTIMAIQKDDRSSFPFKSEQRFYSRQMKAKLYVYCAFIVKVNV